MKHHFKLSEFPDSNFEIDTPMLIGKIAIKMDGNQLEKSKERGRPFLAKRPNGEIVKMFAKPAFPDSIPTLEINGVKHRIAEKLAWYQYVIGGIPLILVFAGGLLGGIFGGIGTVLNYNIFRQEGDEVPKYIKVVGVIVASVTIYAFIVYVVVNELHK